MIFYDRSSVLCEKTGYKFVGFYEIVDCRGETLKSWRETMNLYCTLAKTGYLRGVCPGWFHYNWLSQDARNARQVSRLTKWINLSSSESWEIKGFIQYIKESYPSDPMIYLIRFLPSNLRVIGSNSTVGKIVLFVIFASFAYLAARLSPCKWNQPWNTPSRYPVFAMVSYEYIV